MSQARHDDELLAGIDDCIAYHRQRLADHEAKTAKRAAHVKEAGLDPSGVYIAAANKADRIHKTIRRSERLRAQWVLCHPESKRTDPL